MSKISPNERNTIVLKKKNRSYRKISQQIRKIKLDGFLTSNFFRYITFITFVEVEKFVKIYDLIMFFKLCFIASM